jgi:colanic acid biosynthesis glycosyl transferase WcaI
MVAVRTRLIFVEQFYYPEGWGGAELPRDLTEYLAGREFEVEVICGADQYVVSADDSAIDPASLGVRICRVPSLMAGPVRRWRLLRQLWFYLALMPLLMVKRRPQVFVVQTNPPLAVFLVALASRLWRVPMIIIAMDIYPEVAEAHGMVNGSHTLGRVLQRIFRWSYRVAQRVVALGPVMRGRLISKGVSTERIVEISNWATGAPGVVRGAANPLRSEWGLQGQFVLVYSGNLGVGHEFETLLRGFDLARRSVPNSMLVIIGGGSRVSEVRELVAELKLAEFVQFSEFLPAARLPESLGLAELAIVTLRPGYEGLIVPSKIFSYMARGIPVMYIGPVSDVNSYVSRSGCGIMLLNGDVKGVARAICDLQADPTKLASLGEAGKKYYDELLARDHGLARYEAVIRSCVAGN